MASSCNNILYSMVSVQQTILLPENAPKKMPFSPKFYIADNAGNAQDAMVVHSLSERQMALLQHDCTHMKNFDTGILTEWI